MNNRKQSELYDIWRYSMKIPETRLTLKGHSRGSERTGFYIPELKIFLDAGIQAYFNPEMILITHCHTDHSFALPLLLTSITTQPIICVPNEHLDLFRDFEISCYRLNRGGEPSSKLIRFLGVSQGDIIPHNNFSIKVMKLDHSVPTVGYGIREVRSKLKKEYINLSGKDICTLKKEGKEISEDILYPQFAFLCDTTTKVFELNPELFDYPSIAIECTFFDEETINIAKESKHTHWKDLKPIVEIHPEITFILIHFSMRYSDINIPDKPKNVIIWDH